MVCRDNIKILYNEEEARFKFEFCRGCALYDECELVEQYARFSDNHPQIHKSQTPTPPTSGGVVRIEATAVRVGEREDVLAPQAPGGVVRIPAMAVPAGERKDAPAQTFDSPIAASGPRTDGRLSYDQEELKDGCIMSRRHVCPIACGSQRVSEGIGDAYKIETEYDSTIKAGIEGRWEPSQPVFISAQTGQGKNFFIENELIPYVRELNIKNNTTQRVLILSNRLALRQQIKNRLNGNEVPDDEKVEIYPYREFADVMTYQSLLQREKHLEQVQARAWSRYIYVICDEAHFFTSDAMFNPHTQKILSAIVALFQDAIRVYMSATPYECLRYILKYEQEYLDLYVNFNKPQAKWKGHKMAFYHFERDYSYLDVKAYSAIDELYETIVESINKRKERWLIFIDDKTEETKVREGLLNYEKEHAKEHGWPLVLNGGADESADNGKEKDSKAQAKARADAQTKRIFVANADIKTNNKNNKIYETYMSIVRNEALGTDTYVLITTSVLDNGVNLKDIENIVVSDMAKAKCLQMVGRARVSGPDDRKTLYVKRFDANEVLKRIGAFEKQRTAYYGYNLAYGEFRDPCQLRGRHEGRFLERYYDGSDSDREDAKHWFGRSMDKPTELYFNKIAKALLDRLVPQYQSIYDEMVGEASSADDKVRRKAGQKYLEYQLSWFGKTYCVDDDVTFADKDKPKKAFIAFLESYAESEEIIAGSEKMEEFRGKFIELFDTAFFKSDSNSRGYTPNKMNRLLKEQDVGYKITGKPQAGPWTVIRFEWKDECPESE